MNSKINLAYIFLRVGILNFVFLVDVILTDPENGFSIFSIVTTKTINIIYYAVICIILLFTGVYILKTNKKIIK